MRTKIIVPILVMIAAVLACSVQATPTPLPAGGIVQGVVYADLNGDGVIDESEQSSRVEGVTVTLTDCGPTQTTLTDAGGSFQFVDLPAGICHISVSKGGWEYRGSYPDPAAYPIPVISDPTMPTSFSIYMAPVMDFLPTDTVIPTATLVPTPVFTSTPSQPVVTPTSENVNCRFGPGAEYLAIGSLRIGEVVPIRGTLPDHSWWQIEDPRNLGTMCWVMASLTTTSGDLSLVPLAPTPTGLVTDLSVTVGGGPTIHGFCGGPNPVNFFISMTTNGPATVKYDIEIYNASDNSLRNALRGETIVFTTFGTQTFDPAGVYKTDCGNFYIRVIVTSPNSKTAQYNWSVVSP